MSGDACGHVADKAGWRWGLWVGSWAWASPSSSSGASSPPPAPSTDGAGARGEVSFHFPSLPLPSLPSLSRPAHLGEKAASLCVWGCLEDWVTVAHTVATPPSSAPRPVYPPSPPPSGPLLWTLTCHHQLGGSALSVSPTSHECACRMSNRGLQFLPYLAKFRGGSESTSSQVFDETA